MNISRNNQIDMTNGPIIKKVVLFALPLVLGNILQQLYTTVDTIVVGKYCDEIALAAVGTSSQPVEILINFFFGMGAAASILTARFTGAGNNDAVKKLLSSATALLYIISIPITVLGLIFGPLLLKLIQVPPETIGTASSYVLILFIGSIASLGYNLNSGILKGLGDSRASLYFLIISCISNIGLDLLFVTVFAFGVKGVAAATVIAQFISWFCTIFYIKIKYPEHEFAFLPKTLDISYIRQLSKLTLPLGFNSSIYSVGHLVVQALVNTQGTSFMAGVSIASKICGISQVTLSAFSNSCGTYAGQNYGANNIERIKKGHLAIPFLAGLITLVIDILFIIFAKQLAMMFTDKPNAIDYAIFYIRLALPFYSFFSVFNGIISYINGCGIIKYPTIINVIALWGVRIPSAYIIVKFFDGAYIPLCYGFSFTFGMIAMLLFYKSKTWKKVVEPG